MKHLGSHDNRFLYFHAFTDQHTLDTRNLFGWYFDTQVTTGNHDTVGYFEDLVDIVDTLLVFDLRNDLDRAVMFVQNALDIHYILLVSDK